MSFPDFAPLDFRFQAVQLNTLSWRDYLQTNNPVASALMAKMQIAPAERPKVKAECLRLLATLKLNRAKMQLISGFVDTYLKLSREEEQQFRTEIAQFASEEEREETMEIVTSWMEEGIQQGVQQGIVQGLQQGIMQGQESLTLRQLRKRLGTLPVETEARIHDLSLSQIEMLGEALLDFTSLAELDTWLAEQGQPV